MTTNDQTIEAQIQAKGKTAPRITPTYIDANIVGEYYFTAADGFIGCRASETTDDAWDVIATNALRLEALDS